MLHSVNLVTSLSFCEAALETEGQAFFFFFLFLTRIQDKLVGRVLAIGFTKLMLQGMRCAGVSCFLFYFLSVLCWLPSQRSCCVFLLVGARSSVPNGQQKLSSACCWYITGPTGKPCVAVFHHGDTVTKDSSWLTVGTCMRECDRQKERRQKNGQSLVVTYPHPPCSSFSSIYFGFSLSLSSPPPLQTFTPKHSAAGLSCQSFTIHPLFFIFAFVWLAVDFPMASARGSSLAPPPTQPALLNQTICSLKWPITDPQIGGYKAAVCLQSEHSD